MIPAALCLLAVVEMYSRTTSGAPEIIFHVCGNLAAQSFSHSTLLVCYITPLRVHSMLNEL